MKALLIASLATAVLAVPTASAHAPFRAKWWKGLQPKEIVHKKQRVRAHMRASERARTRAVRAEHEKAIASHSRMLASHARDLRRARSRLAALARARAARRAAAEAAERAAAEAAERAAADLAAASSASSGYSDSSGYESAGSASGSAMCGSSCVQCESGGNPQAVSPDGTYWGLYQFDRQTWAAHGGNPASYGSASAAEQAAVAANASSDLWPNC